QFISDANLTQILYLLRRDLKGFGLSQFFFHGASNGY
ncbi:hypothetical protein SEEN0624_03073, partial [Salmonella enterica subsp. enterica serovar Newport str. PRS_2010_0624]